MDDKAVSPLKALRRFLIGKPIATSKAHHERLGPLVGLAVFSSDALSSVAYATEAILSILILKSATSVGYQVPLTLGIVGLILIIAISYNQTIHAYPSGGGSYSVASENLGKWPGLIAGGALLVDYILTVSVSVAAGCAAIVSAVPSLHSYLVPMAVLCVAILAWANLRGVKESGAAFAIPTYGFVMSVLALLIVGMVQAMSGSLPAQANPQVIGSVGIDHHHGLYFLLARAFAAGCTALTGIEAVSNGVQAFRQPESKNASITLRWMVILLSVMFLGIGLLANHLPTLKLLPAADKEYRTLLAQIAAQIFGDKTVMFYVLQYATAAILVLAANTAFADFPRLASLLARDGYLPRPMARQGDRLVFHNGILVLAGLGGLLIVIFKGELDLLLPLYAVGVFTAFTLSQSGMVVHWLRHREKNWKYALCVNATGAFLSFVVLCIIAVTKFAEGAWIILIAVPLIVFGFHQINRRYGAISRQLAIQPGEKVDDHPHLSILLVPRVHRGILQGLEYARQLKGEVQAVHVIVNDKTVPQVRRDWDRYAPDVPLVVLSSPYRSLIEPVIDYVDELRRENRDSIITVIVAEAVATKPWHKLLQENVAMQIKTALSLRPNIIVSSVRYFLE
ncbi:MAG: APC family permease [Armatimonadetes bacterium]|nr:APC family permease [Armatimonadota bacterium]